MPLLYSIKNWVGRHRRVVPEALWQPARSLWFLLVSALWRPRQKEHTYLGRRLKVWITDPIAREWYDDDWTESREIAFLKEAARTRGQGGLRPGAVVFDLGAHQGVVAMMLANEILPGGKLVALEASARNARLARDNVASNALSPHLMVLHAAAGADDGEIVFNDGFNGHVGRGKSLTSAVTPMRSVDSLAAEHGHPALVFIDVEGFEAQVLRGARDTLTAGRTDFFVEVHAAADLARFGASPEQIVAAFPPSRFDLHAMGDAAAESAGGFRPIAGQQALLGSGRRFYLIATWK